MGLREANLQPRSNHTDAHKAYLVAVEDAFGADLDYAKLQRIYGAPSDEETRRYSPAKCIGFDLKVVGGDPDPAHAGTSYVERSNLTVPMGNRRLTRLANGFSKKIDNHRHMIALFFFYYNFCRVHSTLRVTAAMEAGVTDHVWTLEEICSLLPEMPSAMKGIDKAAYPEGTRGASKGMTTFGIAWCVCSC
jgi:hypothetical protein